MESTSEYIARKREELAFLLAHAGANEDIAVSPTVDEIITMKFRLRARLMTRMIEEHWDVTESNWNAKEAVEFAGYTLKYGYQRFDLSISSKPMYPHLQRRRQLPPFRSAAAYASSGMGAIATVLLALDQLTATKGGASVYALEDGYFETLHTIRTITRDLRLELAADCATLGQTMRFRTVGPPARVLLIDSITADDASDFIADLVATRPTLILFDTTCYELGADEIDRVLVAGLAVGAPIVLLRSHVKLDSLGTEYGRLGSATFVRPGSIHGESKELFANLVGVYRDVLCRIGTRPVHTHLIPFLHDAEFSRLNKLRLQRLGENTLALTESLRLRLDGERFRIGCFHHQKYLTLEPPTIETRDSLLRRIGALASRARDYGVPIRRADSFGFDFVALTDFVDLKRDRHVLRVALADLPEPVIERVSDVLVEWTNHEFPDHHV